MYVFFSYSDLEAVSCYSYEELVETHWCEVIFDSLKWMRKEEEGERVKLE
jgi:hypothetical protein